MELFGVDLEELEIAQVGNWPLFLRISVMVIFGMVTLWLGYVSDLSDKLDKCKALTEKIESSKKAFADAQFKVANLESYKKEVKIVQEQLALLSEELPQQNELAGFLDDASQQAASSGVKLIAIQPLKDANKGFYSETEVSLKMTGDYNALGAFASNIAGMKRIVTIHNFQIKKNENPDDGISKGSLEFDFSSKTYWAAKSRNTR